MAKAGVGGFFIFTITSSLASRGLHRILHGDLQLAQLLDLMYNQHITQLGLLLPAQHRQFLFRVNTLQHLTHVIFSHLDPKFTNILHVQFQLYHLIRALDFLQQNLQRPF